MIKNKTSKNPIFIIGVGRSGTTLIQSMLNAHQNIAFPPETHFVRNYLGNKKVRKKVINNDYEFLKNKINTDKSLDKLDLNYNKLIDKVKQNGFKLEKLYKEILLEYAVSEKLNMIGDKDPKNIEYLSIIKKYFPNSYIIHIIRDPRDVMLSRMKADWSKGRPLWLHALTYRAQIKKGRRDGEKLFGDNYFELNYENLITNPEKELINICEFLNVNYDKNMLKFNQKADEIIKGEEKKWKDKCFKPVISNNKNKWKEKMNKKEVLLTEFICKVAFDKLDYNKSGYDNNMSLKDKVKYNLISKSSNLFDILYRIYHYLRQQQVKKY